MLGAHRPRARRAGLGLAAVAALSVGLGAAAGALAGPRTTVQVALSEWKLAPSKQTVAAGTVTFKVRNAGTMDHEFVVMRTDAHHHLLKVKRGKAVEVAVQGEIPKIVAGQVRKITLNLKPGKYVLLCNMLGHYKAGQYAAFRVR